MLIPMIYKQFMAMERRFIFYARFLVSVIIPICEASAICSVNGIHYLCSNIGSMTDFPLALPSHIRKVSLVGTNELYYSFPDERFRHPTWANVSELSIVEFNNANHIKGRFLNGLKELKFLSISSCPTLGIIDPDVFYSTPDLEALHLDWNPTLTVAMVEAALNGTLSKLKYLSLIGIQTNRQHVVLGDSFSKALHRKNLTYFDIRGVNIIYVDHAIELDIIAYLKYLNISYSTIVSPSGLNDHALSIINNIEVLDITGCQYMVAKYFVIEGERKIYWDFPPTATYIFAQSMLSPHIQLRINVRYIFDNCDLKFPQMLDLSKNSLTHLNITYSGSCRIEALETLNLEGNNMEYISPQLLSSFPSLKILDLSTNQLHNMQDMDDFSYMFSQNKDLEIIFLNNNHLSVIPSKLFSSNKKLRLIDLSENELIYFNIDSHNTADLKLINLRKNRLKSLSATFLEQFEKLFRKQDSASNESASMTNVLLLQFQDRNRIGKRFRYGYNASENIKFEESHSLIPQNVMINILENQFVCDCETLVFMEWILFTGIDIVNSTSLACKYGNNEKLLNNELFEMVKETCQLASLIGIGAASSVGIIIIIITFTITIHLRRKSARRNQDLEILKREILQENTDIKFIVFLSYCSQDSQIVDEHILPSLNRYLHDKFNTERDLVCTGADSFVPGMRIIEEIHRCINESLVLVPVITPAFLQSHWSQEECVAAVDRHRQVVILMKQHTDTSRAIVTIQNLIGQYTRGTWSDNEGHFIIRPSWNTICEGIIRGASESFRQYRRHHFIPPIEELPLVEKVV